MLKKIILTLIMVFLNLDFQAHGMRRPQTGLQSAAYKPTYNEQQVESFKEALFLLNQHYWDAMRHNQYLPDYFYQQLDRYYEQVPYNMTKIRNEFSKLKQAAEELREPALAATQPLSPGSEEWSIESLE